MARNEIVIDPPEARIAGTICSTQITKMWKSQFGIDVSRFFSEPEFGLVVVPPYNYYRFTSVRSGDAEFYASLMSRMGYDRAEKAEFRQAGLEITPRDKVLDVGSGIGNFSVVCTGEYRGVETNPRAVEDARKLGRNVHLGFVQDEKPNSFDVVTVFQVLEHVEDPKSFLQACVKCLRPGGRLIVSTPNLNGIMGYLSSEILNYPPHHMSWWSASSLQALIADCDCKVAKFWEEPLQRVHMAAALSALIWPRSEKHLTNSWLFPSFNRVMRLLARVASRKWDEVPFVKGHAVMVVATKTSSPNT
jgi:SAM-dependent methyltransferase